ncbi:hypothetical protein BDV06DRAFT_112191 [Aspergillus oleicola]
MTSDSSLKTLWRLPGCPVETRKARRYSFNQETVDSYKKATIPFKQYCAGDLNTVTAFSHDRLTSSLTQTSLHSSADLSFAFPAMSVASHNETVFRSCSALIQVLAETKQLRIQEVASNARVKGAWGYIRKSVAELGAELPRCLQSANCSLQGLVKLWGTSIRLF